MSLVVLLLIAAVAASPTCDYTSINDCVNVCYCCWDEQAQRCSSVYDVSLELSSQYSEGSFNTPSQDICLTYYNTNQCADLHHTVVDVKNNPWVLSLFILETLAIVGAAGFFIWRYVVQRHCWTRYNNI